MTLLPLYLELYLCVGLVLLAIGSCAVHEVPPNLEKISGRPLLIAIAIAGVMAFGALAWPFLLIAAARRHGAPSGRPKAGRAP